MVLPLQPERTRTVSMLLPARGSKERMITAKSMRAATSPRAALSALIILLLAIASAGCTLAAMAQGVRSLTGTVFDPAGRAVAGAQIQLHSASGAQIIVTTASDGKFTIEL